MEPSDAHAPDRRTATDGDRPRVACELGDQDPEARAEQVEDELAPRYRGHEELEDGYVFRFADDGGALDALARFVAKERACCAFADYRIATAPPHDEARLTVAGPDGAKDLFGWLAAWLEDAAEGEERDGDAPVDGAAAPDCGC